MRPAGNRQQCQLPALYRAHPPRLALRKEGIKYVFVQDIYRLPDLKPVIKSTVETVCVVNGRLSDSALFNEIFAPYLNQ